MYRTASALMLVATSLAAGAQANSIDMRLAPQTTLPIVFNRTISAKNAHVGDAISAETIQNVVLPNGVVLKSGSKVIGHVVDSAGFVYDKTDYAKQKNSVLMIYFDAVETREAKVPLNVTVRALADALTSEAAQTPQDGDLGAVGLRHWVGGEYLIPREREVRNGDGDVVAYNKKGGVYAHLISNGRCDGGSTEVSMGIFSATACGVYGYVNVSATEFGSQANPSTLTLTSFRTSPTIWKRSTVLLEVLPQQQASVER